MGQAPLPSFSPSAGTKAAGGGVPEAALTWQGGEEVKCHGSASGSSLGCSSKLLLEPGQGLVLPRHLGRALAWSLGTGCSAWLCCLCRLPSSSGVSTFISNQHYPTCLTGLWADSTDVVHVGVSPKPGRPKGIKVLPVGDLLRVPTDMQ